jgi:hypothetical protein
VAQQGGTVTVNDTTIVVPCNSVIEFPANTLTWSQLLTAAQGGTFKGSTFTPAPTLQLPPSAGPVGPYPSVEVTIFGNYVNGTAIAGLILPISGELANAGSGFIVGFDYAKGAMLLSNTPGGLARTRIQINDPVITDPSDPAFNTGRYSAGQSPDTRFSVDQANPTIVAASGYPMCIPRVDPATGNDPKCPKQNRPVGPNCRNFAASLPLNLQFRAGGDFAPTPAGQFCHGFVMKASGFTSSPGQPLSPATHTDATGTAQPTGNLQATHVASQADINAGREPDATRQAPFEIGDFVTYSGELLLGSGGGPADPVTGSPTDTISANTIAANVGIFTEPGTVPSYIQITSVTIGVNDVAVAAGTGAPQEVDTREFLDAFTSDVLSIADIYFVDRDPSTGAVTNRWTTPLSQTGGVGAVGTNGVTIDGGLTTQFDGAVPGRVRLQAVKSSPASLVDSPTRFIGATLRSLCDPANVNGNAPAVPTSTAATSGPCLQRSFFANGLFTGQYQAPIFSYKFPEALIPGDPVVPNNLWRLGFLVNGEGPGTGPLTPTPW